MTSEIPVPAAAGSDEPASEITKRPPGARPTRLPGERILKIFKITGLTKVFSICQSVDQAIAARK